MPNTKWEMLVIPLTQMAKTSPMECCKTKKISLKKDKARLEEELSKLFALPYFALKNYSTTMETKMQNREEANQPPHTSPKPSLIGDPMSDC